MVRNTGSGFWGTYPVACLLFCSVVVALLLAFCKGCCFSCVLYSHAVGTCQHEKRRQTRMIWSYADGEKPPYTPLLAALLLPSVPLWCLFPRNLAAAEQGEDSAPPGGFPNLGSGWRDKLLLQALRETGEEMKRRRRTHKEVRARRAAEEEEAAMHSGGGSSSSAGSHGSGSHGNGGVAIVALQAGGEGRWKPPLSRRATL